MRNARLALTLALLPGALAAQDSARVSGQARAEARAQVPAGFSAEARTRLEAMILAAEEQGLPGDPLSRRMAEGQAKGASEEAIIAAAAKLKAGLQVALAALEAGGHQNPTAGEITRGALALEKGVTRAELEAVARSAPGERRLAVAFEVLTDLAARGMPVDQALAMVTARLEGGATDAQLIGLTASADARANAGRATVTGAAGVGVRKP